MDRSLLCARTNSSFRYHERITHAIRYFEQHVELPVSLQLFAKQCRVSQYHFHRLFHKLFGEPLGKYVRRSRLELAARHLIYSDQTVDAIAPMVGYKSPTVFSRAFKRHFRMAPTEYRAAKRVLQNVKIDDEFGHGALIPAGYQTMEGIHVVCVRRSGSFSIAAVEAWNILEQQAQLKPFFAAHPQRIALVYDPPEITPESYRRFDAGIVVPEDFVAQGVLMARRIFRGNYARFRHVGPSIEVWKTCHAIFDDWAVVRQASLATIPLLIWYTKSSDGLDAEVYVPVTMSMEH